MGWEKGSFLPMIAPPSYGKDRRDSLARAKRSHIFQGAGLSPSSFNTASTDRSSGPSGNQGHSSDGSVTSKTSKQIQKYLEYYHHAPPYHLFVAFDMRDTGGLTSEAR